METQNSFATILENESVAVSALLCAETLKIKVKVTDSANEHFGSVFTAEITEKERKEKLNDYFFNLQQVLEYIEEDKLIKVDLEERKITLWELTKLKREILLLTSELTKEENYEKKHSQHSYNLQCLSQISNRCLEKSEIQNDQIKQYFEIIANELITLRKDKENKNEQNEMKNQLFSENELPFKMPSQISDIKFQQYISSINKVQNQNEQFLHKINEKSQQKFTDKICELQKQISLQNEKIETLETKINEKSEKITENAEKIYKLSLLENNLSSKTENVEQRFVNLETKMKYLNNIVNEEVQKLQRLQKLQKEKQKQMSLMQKCKNQKTSNDFNFDGKTLTKINYNFNLYLYQNVFTFFEQIVFDVQFTFNVKIIQQKKYSIWIGVFDYENYAEDDQNENNYVRYLSDGYKYPKRINQGNGFKVNDFVTVTVNRNTETVKYFVNDKLQVTQIASFLRDRNTKLFPFVEMWDEGDKIEFTF